MRIMTLCLPIRVAPVKEVLLGRKKRGFGQGKYTGFGGKVMVHETIVEAAVRELEEEAGLIAKAEELSERGVIHFCFPHTPDWDQCVYVYWVERWVGTPAESEEMAPTWFAVTQLPYAQMWQDAPFWLPRVLNGDRLNLKIVFAADNESVARVDQGLWFPHTSRSLYTCGVSCDD